MKAALEDYGKLLEVRDAYTRALEEKVVAGEFKKSQETGAKMTLPESFKPLIEAMGQQTLEELFVCSCSQIAYEGDEIKVEIIPAEGEKCPRCWNYRELNEHGVCDRCGHVLDDLGFKYDE